MIESSNSEAQGKNAVRQECTGKGINGGRLYFGVRELYLPKFYILKQTNEVVILHVVLPW